MMHHERILYIAFVWNQHQPFYKDTLKNEYIMPWVRLHAAKDYYQMAAILLNYPEIKQTFNLTPSLLQQLEDYINAGSEDYYMRAMKPPETLSENARRFLLQHFFDIQWDRVINRYPRYRELLDRQGRQTEPKLDGEVLEKFSDQDFRDLQVWFNLAWIDPEIRENDPFLNELVKKERDFTEDEKQKLVQIQMEILKKVVPLHRQLHDRGQMELMTTPFYHPIMPLLIDSDCVGRANPGIPVPERFSYPEDVRAQIEASLEQYACLFGGRPYGLWPSEQAVSPEIIPVCSELGFQWIISDEQILAKSMEVEIIRDNYGHVMNPDVLYQPYMVSSEGREIAMVFRDHNLSDRIGFEYQHFNGEDAAGDLVHRFHRIRENLGHADGNYLVTVSLDGENAWEWYPDDKRTFLHSLYRRLTEDPYLQCVTVSGFLKENPPRRSLHHLFTGSWVDHSLARWIGTNHKNAMWDLLNRARQKTEEYRNTPGADENKLKCALENIHIAEGSDYHWWVDSMPYYLAAPFEALFRKHLANVYRCLDHEPPEELFTPIIQPAPHEASFSQDPLAGPITIVKN